MVWGFMMNNMISGGAPPVTYEVYVEFPPVGLNAIEGTFNAPTWGIASPFIPAGARPTYVGTATAGTTELCNGEGFLQVYNGIGFFSVTGATLNYVNLIGRSAYEMEIANPTGTMTVTVPLGV
jgi:hypothetical protein